MVALDNLKKYYGSHLALDIPSFVMEHGIYWLKGINGSGKTTLMKLVAGLLPFEGDVRLNNEISLKKQRMGYLQAVNYAEAEPLFPPFLTGMDLLQLFVRSKNAAKEQADELISTLQVNSFISNPVGTYSSGMVKKISLILAFIGRPKLILLDEPLVTIDDRTVPVINNLINEYHQKNGVTFLLTSHQAFEHTAFPVANQLLMENKTISSRLS